ncbi:MAG: T9SS type A sorting domain-containing protein [Flavobacteriales bacterium]|nr:T9SS type A sorting domain-containing protein [Flavobacteriales bacterium]
MERQDGRLVTVGWGANTVIDAEDIWLVQYTSVPVGIEEGATRGAFSIAPNPVDRFFTITRNVPFDARTRVVVHDALGREVIAPFSVTQNSIDVDAASLTPGAYILTLHTSTGTSTQRLVKH